MMMPTTTLLNSHKERQPANRGPTPSLYLSGGRSRGGGALTSQRPLELKLNMGANVSSGVGGVCMRSAAGRDVRG